MTAVLNNNDNVNENILYRALELSNKTWRLGFGQGQKVRQVAIACMDAGKGDLSGT